MTAYYNENETFCAEWLRLLALGGELPFGEVDARSIEDVCADDLKGFTQCHFFAGIGLWAHTLERAGWGGRSVWTGSCPCQSFSSAGKGLGFADERHLWPAWFWLIEQCRPDTIFGEQVASPLGRAWLDLVFSDLEALGYTCGAVVFPAAGVGAPQARHRIYWVASAEGSRRIEGRAHARKDFRLAECGSNSRELGAADSAGRSPRRFASTSVGYGSTALATSSVGRLGGAECAGLAQRSITTEFERPLWLEGPALGTAEPVRGFWAGADWIWHRDGKYRPVEPGTFPLASGYPGRVGLLRAYGNSIVVEAAKVFIEAYMTCL